jgi:NADP-dependent 3-hydroxy acid dehydrogenase YdfG
VTGNRRYALVIGGGGRLGSAVVQKLASRGYGVLLWGRTHAGLAAHTDDGIAIAYELLDVADPSATEAATERLLTRGHRVAAVVNVAGMWTGGTLAELAPVEIEVHIRTVVNGSVHAARAALRLLAGEGAFVQVAAASARPGYPDTALNTLAKRTQDGLQEALVRELRRQPRQTNASRVRVTTVYPDTMAQTDSDEVRAGVAMTYEDVAQAIMFAIHAPPTVDVREIVLTAPNSGQWTGP